MALGALSVLQVAGPTHALGQTGEQVVPWLTLADIKARPRHEVDFTLEWPGNTGTGLASSLAASATPAGRERDWRRLPCNFSNLQLET